MGFKKILSLNCTLRKEKKKKNRFAFLTKQVVFKVLKIGNDI